MARDIDAPRATRHSLCASAIAFAAILSIFPFGSFAAAAQAQSAPVFRARSDLVLVPVVVHRHRQYLPGLPREAFKVFQDGHEQTIATFEEIHPSVDSAQVVALAAGEFSNETPSDRSARRYTVVAIDRINTTADDMGRLRDAVTKFLASPGNGHDSIQLLAINPSGIEFIQHFTEDRTALAKALTAATASPGRERESDSMARQHSDDTQALALDLLSDLNAAGAERLLTTLDFMKASEQRMIAARDRDARSNSLLALRQIAMSLADLPGRKSLVWISSGYPFATVAREYRNSKVRDGSAEISAGVTYDYSAIGEATGIDRQTMRLLNLGNVALYPVDARSIVNTAYDVADPSHKYSPTFAAKQYAQARDQEIVATFEHVAAATGGKPCYGRTNLTDCLDEAFADSRNYYLVGYYLNRGNLDPGWHKISVTVAAEGTTVRSRNGFLVSKSGPEETRAAAIALELLSPLSNTGIPIHGHWTFTQRLKNKRSAALEMQLPGSAGIVGPDTTALNLDVIAQLRRPDGSVAAEFAKRITRQLSADDVATIQQAGIVFRHSLVISPGKYIARIVVRDAASGRIGSVSTQLQVN